MESVDLLQSLYLNVYIFALSSQILSFLLSFLLVTQVHERTLLQEHLHISKYQKPLQLHFTFTSHTPEFKMGFRSAVITIVKSLFCFTRPSEGKEEVQSPALTPLTPEEKEFQRRLRPVPGPRKDWATCFETDRGTQRSHQTTKSDHSSEWEDVPLDYNLQPSTNWDSAGYKLRMAMRNCVIDEFLVEAGLDPNDPYFKQYGPMNP